MKTLMRSPVHTAVVERFLRLKAHGRLAHAYLFTGPRGIGKSQTALALAKQLNCLKDSLPGELCDCPSCCKIDSGNHPDIYVLRRPQDKASIPVEMFRELITRLQLRPVEARLRVCVIEEADEVKVEAANVFLKTLEEPRADTLLILTTSVPEAVLKTVLSRCHQVLFFPLGDSELAEWLAIEYHVGPKEASVLSRLAWGSPGRARELGPGFLETKNSMIDRYVLSAGLEDPVLKAYTADKETARLFWEVLLTFFRDAVLLKRGLGEKFLVHADRVADLRKLAARYSQEDLAGIISGIVKAMRGMKENMNAKVAAALLKEMM
jgi:DNA polymerase-3 subunit delta'